MSQSEDVQAPPSERDATSKVGSLYWLPSITFILHTLEELPGFAAWVSRHFGALTTETFVVSHVPLVLLVGVASFFASKSPPRKGWIVFSVAAQFQFGLNAVFHITTSFLFQEYSPGVLTASTVSIPFTIYLLIHVAKKRQLSRLQFVASLILGGTIAAAAIGVLFLHPKT